MVEGHRKILSVTLNALDESLTKTLYIAIAIFILVFCSEFLNTKETNKQFAENCANVKHGTVFYEYDSFMLVCVRGEKIN